MFSLKKAAKAGLITAALRKFSGGSAGRPAGARSTAPRGRMGLLKSLISSRR